MLYYNFSLLHILFHEGVCISFRQWLFLHLVLFLFSLCMHLLNAIDTVSVLYLILYFFSHLTLKINYFFQSYSWEVGRKPTTLGDNCYDLKQHAGTGMLAHCTAWIYISCMLPEKKRINDSRSLRWWCNKAVCESLLRADSLVALMHHCSSYPTS